MNIRIEPDDSAAALIEKHLLESLRTDITQSRNDQIVLVAKTDDDTLTAGLVASVSYGWLLIKALWVDENERRKGIGTALMMQAETRAGQFDCHSAWLDTSSSRAKLFYEKLGYCQFAALQNTADQFPASHRRWFMAKTL